MNRTRRTAGWVAVLARSQSAAGTCQEDAGRSHNLNAARTHEPDAAHIHV